MLHLSSSFKNDPNLDSFQPPAFDFPSFHQETSEFAEKSMNFDDLIFFDSHLPLNCCSSLENQCSSEERSLYFIQPNLIKEDKINKSIEKIVKPVFLTKKRGKNTNKKQIRKRKTHVKYALDNVLVKIQVHFLNFLVDFANDALKHIIKDRKYYFLKLNYNFKRNIKYNHFNELKTLKIKEILSQDISNKYKLTSKETNKEIILRVTIFSNWLKAFFDIDYLKAFNIYYNKLKPLKKVIFQGIEINLSSQTKSFNNLLKNNKEMKDIIITTVEDVYFNGNKNLTEKFSVEKYTEEKKNNYMNLNNDLNQKVH